LARREIVTLTDDTDGSEAAETVSFGYRGKSYEIDLSEKNAQKLDDVMALYIGHARRAGGSHRSARSSTPSGVDPKAVRAWAIEQGYEVSARGRVSADLIAAYNAG
jgi:hypothetical protein